MSPQALASSPHPALYQAWQALLRETPHLRARDAAARLGVSEAELIACRLGVDSLRLRPDWRQLLPALGALGRVMVLTRNEHCVHERKGWYRDVSIAPNAQMGLVVSPDIDLRFFLAGWASVFAVEQQTPRGVQRSLQVFDRQGVAVHKVFLTEDSDLDAWGALLGRFGDPDQASLLTLEPAPPPVVERPDDAFDAAALRADWAALQDTHHFHAMVKRHGASRLQALRLAGVPWAEPLPPSALPALLTRAGTAQVLLMVFVGNRHCIQIHSGTLHNLRWVDDWFNVLDPDFNLHLKAGAVAQLWRVRKPSVDGVITSWEAYDAAGELILQLFGVRKPGTPECAEWRALAEATPAAAG